MLDDGIGHCDYTETQKSFASHVKHVHRQKGSIKILPIATRPWDAIGMDFVGPFPEVKGYNYLCMVICRMTSMVHLVPVHMEMTASQLSSIYMCEIIRLHGLPSSIVCN